MSRLRVPLIPLFNDIVISVISVSASEHGAELLLFKNFGMQIEYWYWHWIVIGNAALASDFTYLLGVATQVVAPRILACTVNMHTLHSNDCRIV
jgi:hypothetical protein